MEFKLCFSTGTALQMMSVQVQHFKLCRYMYSNYVGTGTALQMIPRPEMIPSENEEWHEVYFKGRVFNYVLKQKQVFTDYVLLTK